MSSPTFHVLQTSSATHLMQHDFVKDTLEADPVKNNDILPNLLKCMQLERQNKAPIDHLWIVIYTLHEGVPSIFFIVSCTNSFRGKHHLIIFTPIPHAYLSSNDLVPALKLLIRTLHHHVPLSRMYSIFGPEVIVKKFSEMWTRLTHIQPFGEAYTTTHQRADSA